MFRKRNKLFRDTNSLPTGDKTVFETSLEAAIYLEQGLPKSGDITLLGTWVYKPPIRDAWERHRGRLRVALSKSHYITFLRLKKFIVTPKLAKMFYGAFKLNKTLIGLELWVSFTSDAVEKQFAKGVCFLGQVKQLDLKNYDKKQFISTIGGNILNAVLRMKLQSLFFGRTPKFRLSCTLRNNYLQTLSISRFDSVESELEHSLLLLKTLVSSPHLSAFINNGFIFDGRAVASVFGKSEYEWKWGRIDILITEPYQLLCLSSGFSEAYLRLPSTTYGVARLNIKLALAIVVRINCATYIPLRDGFSADISENFLSRAEASQLKLAKMSNSLINIAVSMFYSDISAWFRQKL